MSSNRPHDTHPVSETDIRQSEVTYDPYAERRATVSKAIQGIYLIFGIIEALIGIRFFLRMLGANPGVPFTDFIYGVTQPFIAPFIGLFGTPVLEGGVIEWHSLVAIVVYALLAWLLARLVWLAFGETRSGYTRSRTTDAYTDKEDVTHVHRG
jgi:ABC-type Na+ efflux pump permease subunit